MISGYLGLGFVGKENLHCQFDLVLVDQRLLDCRLTKGFTTVGSTKLWKVVKEV